MPPPSCTTTMGPLQHLLPQNTAPWDLGNASSFLQQHHGTPVMPFPSCSTTIRPQQFSLPPTAQPLNSCLTSLSVLTAIATVLTASCTCIYEYRSVVLPMFLFSSLSSDPKRNQTHTSFRSAVVSDATYQFNGPGFESWTWQQAHSRTSCLSSPSGASQ